MIIGFRYDIFFDDVNPEVLFFSNKVVSIIFIRNWKSRISSQKTNIECDPISQKKEENFLVLWNI